MRQTGFYNDMRLIQEPQEADQQEEEFKQEPAF